MIPEKHSLAAIVLVLALIPGSLCGFSGPEENIRNFHQINDHIYRGAQPGLAGFKSLAQIGVKTVIDLREGSEQHNGEKKMVEEAGMRYISIPMNGFTAPSNSQVAQVLELFDDSTAWPVFVHCKRGADRTGTVVACYRISHDHWQQQKALTEARIHGMSWIEHGMQEYVLHFQPSAQAAHPSTPAKPAAPAAP